MLFESLYHQSCLILFTCSIWFPFNFEYPFGSNDIPRTRSCYQLKSDTILSQLKSSGMLSFLVCRGRVSLIYIFNYFIYQCLWHVDFISVYGCQIHSLQLVEVLKWLKWLFLHSLQVGDFYFHIKCFYRYCRCFSVLFACIVRTLSIL